MALILFCKVVLIRLFCEFSFLYQFQPSQEQSFDRLTSEFQFSPNLLRTISVLLIFKVHEAAQYCVERLCASQRKVIAVKGSNYPRENSVFLLPPRAARKILLRNATIRLPVQNKPVCSKLN